MTVSIFRNPTNGWRNGGLCLFLLKKWGNVKYGSKNGGPGCRPTNTSMLFVDYINYYFVRYDLDFVLLQL